MKRTQIYLTQQQVDKLQALARAERMSTSQVIRGIIDKRLAKNSMPKKPTKQSLGNTLLGLAEWAEENMPKDGPKDLASSVDEYLYGNHE